MPVYMKRSEPLVDAVRKSWELNADLHQFFLRNPAWTKRIESLLKEAVPGLGLKADQRRKIYKLVLKGPSFYRIKIPRKPTNFQHMRQFVVWSAYKAQAWTHLESLIKRERPEVSSVELNHLLNIMSKWFCYSPKDRLSATELLQDPSFQAIMEIHCR